MSNTMSNSNLKDFSLTPINFFRNFVMDEQDVFYNTNYLKIWSGGVVASIIFGYYKLKNNNNKILGGDSSGLSPSFIDYMKTFVQNS